MDLRLGLVMVATGVITSFVARWWWPNGLDDKGSKLSDLAWIPLVVGVVVARLATVALDHPAGIASLKEVMIIRGGTDFWIGVVAGVAAIGLTVKDRCGVLPRLALLAPFGLIAYGVYHSGCVVQDGCPGPAASIGLTQNGIDQRVFPIGLVGGMAAMAAGVWFMRRPPARSPMAVVGALLGVLVAIRLAVSVLTPSLVGFPSRDQVLSLLAASVAVGLLAGAFAEQRRGSPHRQRSSGGGAAAT